MTNLLATAPYTFSMIHGARIAHDYGWLLQQKGPVIRETMDPRWKLKKGTTIVDLAVPFAALTHDWKTRNIEAMVRQAGFYQEWILDNPDAPFSAYIDTGAKLEYEYYRVHVKQGNLPPWEKISPEEQLLNHVYPIALERLNDPVIFIGGTMGDGPTGNHTGDELEKLLLTFLKPWQVINAKLPPSASWRSISQWYEDLAKEDPKVLDLMVIGTPGDGRLSTYTLAEIPEILNAKDSQTIVLFDSWKLEERSERVWNKLRVEWPRKHPLAGYATNIQDALTLIRQKMNI